MYNKHESTLHELMIHQHYLLSIVDLKMPVPSFSILRNILVSRGQTPSGWRLSIRDYKWIAIDLAIDCFVQQNRKDLAIVDWC